MKETYIWKSSNVLRMMCGGGWLTAEAKCKEKKTILSQSQACSVTVSKKNMDFFDFLVDSQQNQII